MYSPPSASQMRLPFPLEMNGGEPPTAENERTGELTPPGISRLASRNSSSERNDIGNPSPGPGSTRAEDARCFLGEVGENQVGTGAPDGDERLHHDLGGVYPSSLAGRP